MKKINKHNFLKHTQNLLVDNKIPTLTKSNIHEFTIGKNFFYEVINNNEIIYAQKWLNSYLQETIELNNAAVAFRKNYSYLHLFEPHKNNYHFLRLDIKAFFSSINIDDIKENFKFYFITEKDLDKKNKVDAYVDEEGTQTLLDAFINLITYQIPEDSNNEYYRGKNVLPMGFICSPAVSNIIFRKLDIQIQKFCAEKNIIYTRYADDMVFSSNKDSSYVISDNFENEISILIAQMNFKLNNKKTIKAKHTISLNGYTIQYSQFENFFLGINKETIINEVRLSNKKIQIINKLLYMLKDESNTHSFILKKLFNYKLNPMKFQFPITNAMTINKYHKDQLLNRVIGYRAYLLSVVNFNKKYSCCQTKTIKKYLALIDELNVYIEKNRP